MHKPLAEPVTVDTPYGPVTCTHEAFGVSIIQPWNKQAGFIRVVGLEVEGEFRAVHAPSEERLVQVDAESPELDTIYAEIERIVNL